MRPLVTLMLAASTLVLTGAGRPVQPELGVRSKPVIEAGALRFKASTPTAGSIPTRIGASRPSAARSIWSSA
jgi:hypothetical protein